MRARVIPLLLLAACAAPEPPPTVDTPFLAAAEGAVLRSDGVREASGLVSSGRFEGVFWTHNDSGDESRIFAIGAGGEIRATVRIAASRNRDWEDMARRADTLFIADIGDNSAVHPSVDVYMVLEPKRLADTVLAPLGRYELRYPDGPRDAEAFLVDPRSGDWLVVTKRERQVRVYRLASVARARAPVDSVAVLERIPGELPFRLAVAGDVSADGTEVLVKTYNEVFYWKRGAGEGLASTLMRPPRRLPYRPEPQGEAIAFTAKGDAYATLSEAGGGGEVQRLLFYRRPP